jgi:hypothetical protein
LQAGSPRYIKDVTDTLLTIQWKGDDDSTWFGLEEFRIKRYPFTIENGVAVIGPGKEIFDLKDRSFPLKEVAVFLEISEEHIISMNPRLTDGSVCTGEILIRESIPPYEPYTGHAYCGRL